MPDRTIHLTDQQKHALDQYAHAHGMDADCALKDLAMQQMRERVSPRFKRGDVSELPKRERGGTFK